MTRWLVVVFLLFARSAAADVPWANGVAEADQQRANALFAEANQLFAQQAHKPALDKYRAAIAIWDHPVIQFNMAVTLVRLDQPLEAADALERSLRFGQAPFTPELYNQLLDYQALLRGRVGEVEASCTQSGAQVLLDGKVWFNCPATRKQRVLAGEHTVVAEHPEFVPHSVRVLVVGGEVSQTALELRSIDSAVIVEYRFQRWIPWTVAGTGVLTALLGVVVSLSASNTMDDYARTVARECAVTGCDLNDGSARSMALNDQRDSAITQGRIGTGVLFVGGAAAVTGIVLVILNRGVRKLPKLEVSPTRSSVAAQASWRF